MSLKQAILGLLHYDDLTGYQISQILDHSVKHYWSTEHTQVYRALGALASDGLVGHTAVAQEERPDKKVYHLTPAGRETFREWLTSALPLPEVRHAQLLQFSFMDALPNDQILSFLDQYEEQLRAKLELYRLPSQLGRAQALARSDRERTLWSLVLDNGIRSYESELAWCQHARQVLQGESHGNRS